MHVACKYLLLSAKIRAARAPDYVPNLRGKVIEVAQFEDLSVILILYIPNIACMFIWNAKVSKTKVAKISAPNKPS